MASECDVLEEVASALDHERPEPIQVIGKSAGKYKWGGGNHCERRIQSVALLSFCASQERRASGIAVNGGDEAVLVALERGSPLLGGPCWFG